jgi:hypothetical protein
MGVAEFDHAGTLGVFDHAAFQRHGAQFIRRTAAWTHENPPKLTNPDVSGCL